MTAARRWCAAALVVGVAWTLRRLSRVEVVGDSMRPALDHGDRLILSRVGRPRPGDVVAVGDPRSPERTMIKRVVDVSAAGFTVLGDNPPASTDSRVFGRVPATTLRGRVVYRYHPAARRGALPGYRPRRPL